jgi:pectate lyase
MSELVAFPCAEGYGKVATGGRGGDVYEVTTLNATGPGSLGEAAAASGPRTVVFRVSGYIEGDINVSNDDITIAGQTAPGDGIAINGRLSVTANNTIIRYLRVRGVGSGDTITNSHNSPNHTQIYDHLSANWSSDEVFSVYFNEEVTIQYCMISEAASGNHQFGGIWGGNHNSYHHNLFAHNTSRNPRIASGSGFNDFRNNVVFNTNQPIHGGEKHEVDDDPLHVVQSTNVVANYIKPGPVNPDINICGPASRDGISDAGSWYVADNYLHGNADVTANNWEGVSGTYIRLDEPSEHMPIRQQTAEEAFETVLEQAGCSMPNRDSLDARIIEEVRTGTVQNGNGLVSSPGALPELQGGVAPADSDHDGMPDAWEMANSLDPNNAEDRNQTWGPGYTMLEKYLNSLDSFHNNDNNSGNYPPVAKIGAVTEMMPGQTVTLDGSDSYDPESNGITYLWTQIQGENIDLVDNSNPTLTFIAPTVDQPTQYTFSLTVNDGEFEDQASVTVLVSPVSSAGLCDTAEENNSLMLICPSGQVITEIKFASYGTPGGSCGSFTAGSCNASNSVSVVSDACKGMNSCTVYAGNDSFGNPCEGTVKMLAAEVVCGMETDPTPVPSQNPVTDSSRLRVIASTDIGGSDSDDEQSMVHFLVYSDHWDVEGLIASPWENGRKEDILNIIDEYEKDYPNLVTHGDYPTADYLRSVTKQGAVDKAPAEGFGEPTEGSEWIAEVAMRDDPRPLWITVWGCIDDVAQALHDHPEIAPKLRVYWIAGPNRKHSPDSSTYLAENHKDLWIIEADETYRGFFNGGDMSNGYGNSDWPQENVSGHGALGDFFMDHRSDIKMGDTPAVTYTLDNAMRNPDDPTQPGWGGSFIPCGGDRPYCWKDDPSQSDEGYDGAATVNVHRKAVLDDWGSMMDRAQAPNTNPSPGPTPNPGSDTDWTNADPKEVVKSGNPGNSKLEHYADNEIGDPTIGLEGTGTARTITGPIVVPPDVAYDGKGETLTAEGLGDGSQDEEQKPYFILLPGASLKNVTLTAPGVEGVHMMGDNTLENIVWEDVGEDAASIRSYFPGGTIRIIGGSANSASDKVFQLNAPSKIIIKNFKATDISKLVRQNAAIPIEVVLDGVTATNVKTALVMCNTSDCTLMYRDVSGSPLTNGPVQVIDWEEGASD